MGQQNQSKQLLYNNNKQFINLECLVFMEKSQTLAFLYWPSYPSVNMARSRFEIFLYIKTPLSVIK